MLGSVCFRLSFRSRSLCPATVAFSHFHPFSSSSYSSQLSHRHSSTSLNFSWSASRLRWLDQHACATNVEACLLQVPTSPVKRFHCHSNSCLLAGNGVVGATIWHALLPSCHLSTVDCDTSSLYKKRTISSSDDAGALPPRDSVTVPGAIEEKCPVIAATSGQVLRKRGVLATFNKCMLGSSFSHFKTGGMNQSFAMGVGLRDGSWNVAWDVRPARWLHGRHSAWLLFGVCACFSAAAGAALPHMLSSNPAQMEAATERPATTLVESDSDAMLVKASHGKHVYTDYSVTGIPGDGRCLFRAIAHGACLRSGKPAPNADLQQKMADELRCKVVDELIKRREESEWFIEGDFDTYVKRMRGPHVWGGEPELLMASHVLKMPITVYMFEKSSEGLISIAEYGQEYGEENSVKVLYHGFGHYDALQFPGSGTYSKL